MFTRVVAKQAKTTKVKNKFVNGKKKGQKNTQLSFWWKGKSSNLPCRFCSNSVGTPLQFAAFRSGFDAKYSRASAFWFFSVHNHGFYGVPNTYCQEKHQHFHADRQLVTKKEISIKINQIHDNERSWPSGGQEFLSFIFSSFFFFFFF